LATIKDIALALGIAPSTVSRGLNGRAGLSEEVRQRILDTAARLGYRPSGIARALRSKTTRTIGLIVPSILNPFFTDLAYAVDVAARARGFSVIIGNSDEEPRHETEYLRIMIERGVDGLLIAPSRDHNAMLSELYEAGTPMVFLDRKMPALDVPTVAVDPSLALEMLASRMAALGFRRIGIVRGPEDVTVARERAALLTAAGTRVGLVFEPRDQIAGHFTVEGGMAAFAVLIQDPPDAIFLTNNLMAQGFLLAAAEAGVDVGRAVAIAAFDDVPLFRLYNPPITAIVQPTRLMGETAVDMLLRRIDGEIVASSRLVANVALRASLGEARPS
jgi:LacI family transcriptional regulator